MKKPVLSLREQIRIGILKKGFSSYQQWADHYGYKRSTVTQVISRHVVDKQPVVGRVARRILTDLAAETNITLM